MSKLVNAVITCPKCHHQFDFTLFRTIWGEEPENRELVMSDKINIATCPSCNQSTKLPYAFMYTNAKLFFAVWWEPSHDQNIDNEKAQCRNIPGMPQYLINAPRIRDWDEFKDTICKFEQMKHPSLFYNKQVNKEMEKYLQKVLPDMTQKPKTSSKGGCLGIIALLICCFIYFIW